MINLTNAINMTTVKFFTVITFALILFLGGGVVGGTSTAHATSSTPILNLDVDPPVIINGQSVTLDWFIDGPVTNCVLSGPGIPDTPISTASVPTLSSMTIIPPEDASSNYTLDCDGTVSNTAVSIKPVITMTLPQGNLRTNDPMSGRLSQVDVVWESRFATRCSNVWRIEESASTTIIEATDGADYNFKNGVSGWVRYDGNPHGYISETTTFYIECFNDNKGTSATSSVTLLVTNPPALDPPVVNVWTNDSTIEREVNIGHAIGHVQFNSQNVNNCSYEAFTLDGQNYCDTQSCSGSLPQGYGASSNFTSRTFSNVWIATSTTFRVTCDRGERTVNSVVYPATSTSDEVTIRVSTTSVINLATGPVVTVFATATPNPVVRDAYTGYGGALVHVRPYNPDRCEVSAYNLSGVQVTVPGWNTNGGTSTVPTSGTTTRSIVVNQSVRLQVFCFRHFERNNFSTSTFEYQNGTEAFELLVLADPAFAPVPPPETFLYGNGVHLNANDIWAAATEIMGYNQISGSLAVGDRKIEIGGGSGNGRIVVPFSKPPEITSDQFDIHLRVCDENGGQSTYTISTADDGVIDTFTTNDPNAPHHLCGPQFNTDLIRQVGTALDLDDGEEITIECTTPGGEQNDELCRVLDLFIGAGAGGSVEGLVDVNTGIADVPIVWVSNNTTFCNQEDAEEPDGTTYPWLFSNDVFGSVTRSISTTTQFGIDCGRVQDLLTDDSQTLVQLVDSVSLQAQTGVEAGECTDPNSGNIGPAPVGYMADINGICVPAVDLTGTAPTLSSPSAAQLQAASSTGIFSWLTPLITIENLGPGDLPSNSNITYKSTLDIDPAWGFAPIVSTVGTFNDALLAGQTSFGTLNNTLPNVPFGNHNLCLDVNLDGAPSDFPEVDFTNNTICQPVFVDVPPPPMYFTASRDMIRSEQSVTIDWLLDVTYQVDNCTVKGAGGLNVGPVGNGGVPFSGSFTTGPLTSTSKFIFQCTEPITNTVFTRELQVDVVPAYQEI